MPVNRTSYGELVLGAGRPGADPAIMKRQTLPQVAGQMLAAKNFQSG
jgi:hypothetical protein